MSGRRAVAAVVTVAAALGLATNCGTALWAAAGPSRVHAAPVSGWDEAVRARAGFEAQPKSRHTQAEFARVMDKFRAIYHDDPAAAHAGRAVEQVAELLAEEGHELGDRKCLRDAARQYEFLAKSYPSPGNTGPVGSSWALGQALDLLGPGEADDATEARAVRAALLREYPASAAARESAAVVPASRRSANHPGTDETVASTRHPDAGAGKETAAAVATVTGIRHWSTGTYTRVAIDLGSAAGAEEQDVAYQAVRVQSPDRIFFDLKDVKLAPELQGKSFTVTDGGLLNNIRAAQLPGGNTRVVLDVHAVGEYSAFLLPNPERLIIDIHGRQEAGRQEAGNRKQEPGNAEVPVESAAAPIERTPADVVATKPRVGGTAVSSLPPMPVTDGSAGFGLPSRPSLAEAQPKPEVARPRVVIPTRPTVAKPVPNSVTKSSANNGDDVAAVSAQTGRVAATPKPTSLPVASSRTADASGGDHYRSPRAVAVEIPPTSQSRDAGHANTRAAPAETASPVADVSGTNETTLMRALGLKIGRIVIDAGHGGHDSGTLGAGGIEEKDVVLDVALRLGKLLHDRLGAEIVYTRADDTFIPLETRTAIANKAQADLFISVHANSSPDASARGVEVYYLNFTSDPDAMNVASRENAVSTQSVHQLSDLVKKIALKDKIDESRELAADVDASLYSGLRKGNNGLKDRGVKKAPFVVLIGANMPSILAEISFVTNPDDAEQLETPEYRERVAESLYKGVAKYAATINHTAPEKGKQSSTERAAVR